MLYNKTERSKKEDKKKGGMSYRHSMMVLREI